MRVSLLSVLAMAVLAFASVPSTMAQINDLECPGTGGPNSQPSTGQCQTVFSPTWNGPPFNAQSYEVDQLSDNTTTRTTPAGGRQGRTGSYCCA